MQEEAQQEKCPLPRTQEAVDWWLKKWGRQAVVDGQEPMRREHVERLIEVNGWTAEELYLWGANLRGEELFDANLQGANLHSADLRGAFLTGANLQKVCLIGAKLQGAHLSGAYLQGANLNGADLQGAYLWSASLQGANLSGARLQGADMSRAKLVGADLQWAHLQGTDLRKAKLMNSNLASASISPDTNLEEVVWHKKYISILDREGDYKEASSSYRTLKTWHQQHGLYEIAGEFHDREWVCRRKAIWKGLRQLIDTSSFGKILLSLIHTSPWNQIWRSIFLWLFYEQLFGYSERPWRVARAALVVIVGLTFVYFPYSWSFCWCLECWSIFWEKVWKSLYFSGVSFTALGYGDWITSEHIDPQGWTRFLGVVESLFGISLIALFLVTFTRKMTR